MKKVIIILALLSMVFGFTAFECGSTELTSAKLYLQQGHDNKAKEALYKEVAKNPQSAEGYFLLGTIHGDQGNIDSMLYYYDKSEAAGTQFQADIKNRRQYYWADNFNKGVGYFNRATKVSDADSVEMFYDRAITAFQNATTIQPDSQATHKNLIFAYMNANRMDDAIPAMENYVERFENLDGYTMLGEVYYNEGVKSMNQFKASGNKADSVAAMEDYNKALVLLKEGKDKYPNDADLLLLLSNSYIATNKLDEAKEAFKEGVQNEPENKFYRYNYGVLLLGGQEYAAAINQFEKALEIDPNYSNALFNLAVANVQWGTSMVDEAAKTGDDVDESYKAKYEAALPPLEKFLELNPDDSRAWEVAGKVYANLGMGDKSEAAFEKADALR